MRKIIFIFLLSVCSYGESSSPIFIEKTFTESGKSIYELTYEKGRVIKGYKYSKNGKKKRLTNAHLHNMGLQY